MNQQKQTKRINFFFALFVFVLLSGFLFSFNINPTNAASDTCTCWARNGFGSYGSGPNNDQPTLPTTAPTQDACSQICKDKGGYYRYGTIGNILPIFNTSKTFGETIVNSTAQDVGNLMKGPLGDVIKALLLGVLKFVGWLLSVASAIFAWTVDAKNLKDVINNKNIYETWQIVRDFLNIAFILVLLYSAFCTILQIENYNYKKILLKLVIMAMLVNFSFPITRFIIDTGNTLMYTILQTLFAGMNSPGEIYAGFANAGQLASIIKPAGDPSVAQLIASIVFVFILAITFLAIAILFLIRIIALAIIIIFSPLAFVGSIISVGGSYSSKWWDNLFKYTFFGPIMVFMIYVAMKIMTSTVAVSGGTLSNLSNIDVQPDLIISMSTFAIPIVILWLGMGVAQSMSIAGAATVMGGAQKFIGKVGKFVGKGAYKAPWWAFKKSGLPGGAKQAYDDWKKRGPLGSAAVAKREARFASRLGVRGAAETDMKKRAEDYKKNNESVPSLKDKCSHGDSAACYRLAEDKDMDQETYDSFMDKNKDDALRKAINSKVKQNRVDLIALNNARTRISTMTQMEINDVKNADPSRATWTDNQVKDFIYNEEVDKEIGKMDAEKFSAQDHTEMLKPLPSTATPEQRRNRAILIRSIRKTYRNKFTREAKGEARKRSFGSANNTASLANIGIR